MNVLVTGAGGWVGAALAAHCRACGFAVRATGRAAVAAPLVAAPDLEDFGDWSPLLRNVDVVVHLAARVHVMAEKSTDALAAFRRVNTEGSLHLARQAAAAGVRRFVFVSSIKVNGESTDIGRPFRHDDTPAPCDGYGLSKAEAESGLREIAAATGLEVVIVRPPLVYGPGVGANFASMMRWIGRGVPLPLGALTNNRRSLVALDNLADLLVTCVRHPAACGQTFLVSDGEDLSTEDLLRRLGRAMERPVHLLPVAPEVLRIGCAMVGYSRQAQRLLGSLQVDISHTTQTLGWRPSISVDEALRRAASGRRG